jgi:hypothetical protein
VKNSLVCMALALAAMPLAAQHHDAVAPHGQRSAYAGQETRDIKALSEQEQRAWLEGQGQGLARAAELNGQPGPMHVLELEAELRLTPAQVQETRNLMARHKAHVRELGARIVDAERRLDLAFRGRRATPTEVERLTMEIGRLQSEARAAHLTTHLEQASLLTAEQIAAYGSLRGYAACENCPR